MRKAWCHMLRPMAWAGVSLSLAVALPRNVVVCYPQFAVAGSKGEISVRYLWRNNHEISFECLFR